MLCVTLIPKGHVAVPEGTYLDLVVKRPCDIRVRISKSTSSRVVIGIEADNEDVSVLRSNAKKKR